MSGRRGRPGRHGGVADSLPFGVLFYPVHDEQRRAVRARLQRDVDAHRARQARYATTGATR